jgi:hypothetical protein
MQREALLSNAAMVITKLTNESNEVQHITQITFGSGSAALDLQCFDKWVSDDFVITGDEFQ